MVIILVLGKAPQEKNTGKRGDIVTFSCILELYFEFIAFQSIEV